MTRVPVRTRLEAYRVAIAELPARTAATDSSAAVAAISGEGEWWREASEALTRGASAVVVARPGRAPIEALAALAAQARDTPVILERPLLRPDAAEALTRVLAAEHPAAALTIECHARSGSLTDALRDAIGWARVLAGGPLEPGPRATTTAGALALLGSASGTPVSVVAAAQPGAPALGRIRVTALAETRIDIDQDGGELVVTTTDAAARRVLPARFERPERLALRRAIDASSAGESPADLEDLRHDAALADLLLSSPA